MSLKTPNHLANEKSPYLLQHRFNPVNWYPWSKEAFIKAKQEDKPIFLSIGYSTCHWCHVMAHESFEDLDVANLLNDFFIAIKVDREERPDIDAIYMQVCQMISGSGGWPLTIFMDADKKPFLAGTYFPKHSSYGRAGLLELLPRIKELWVTAREKLVIAGEEILEEINKATPSRGEGFSSEILEETYLELEASFDSHYGGFQDAPKFPTPHKMLFLLRYWYRTKNAKALTMVEKTLQEMRKGGIYDHLGFGFHRYATDARWLIPHFEKMLYDQALLAIVYLEMFQITKKTFYRQVAEEIFTYVLRELTDDKGGFFSAIDADSENIEGKFYTWTIEELKEVLNEQELTLVTSIFNVKKAGSFDKHVNKNELGRNVLYLEKNLPELFKEHNNLEKPFLQQVEEIRRKLFQKRNTRKHPIIDTKILTDWNGLMIAALAIGGRILGEKRYLDAAEKSTNFILNNMTTKDKRLLHQYCDGEAMIHGMVDDYSFFIWGLLELYQSTFKTDYLFKAIEYNKMLVQYFWDEKNMGLFFTPNDGEVVLIRRKEIYDGAIPSGNAVSLLNFLKIARITGDFDLEKKAMQINEAFSSLVDQALVAHTMFITALDYLFGNTSEIVIVGLKDSKAGKKVLEFFARNFIPNKVIVFIPTEEKDLRLSKINGFKNYSNTFGKEITIYICSNRICNKPIFDISHLKSFFQLKN